MSSSRRDGFGLGSAGHAFDRLARAPRSEKDKSEGFSPKNPGLAVRLPRRLPLPWVWMSEMNTGDNTTELAMRRFLTNAAGMVVGLMLVGEVRVDARGHGSGGAMNHGASANNRTSAFNPGGYSQNRLRQMPTAVPARRVEAVQQPTRIKTTNVSTGVKQAVQAALSAWPDGRETDGSGAAGASELLHAIRSPIQPGVLLSAPAGQLGSTALEHDLRLLVPLVPGHVLRLLLVRHG